MKSVSDEAKDSLNLVPISLDRLKETYPLVRDMAPHVTEEQWQEYVSPILKGDPESGVRAIESAHGFIRGLCVYRVVKDLDGSKNFVIVELVVSRTLYRKAAARALIAELENEARNKGCTGIVTDCPVESRWLFDLASQEGYRLLRWRMSKKLDPSTEV